MLLCCMLLLQASGPLFGDIDVINFKLREYLDQQVDKSTKKVELKCTTCGFPNCECKKCIFINARRDGPPTKSKCSVSHDCRIAQSGSKGGQPPSGGYYMASSNKELEEAWAELGCSSIPQFVKGKNGSGYFWPEEMEE